MTLMPGFKSNPRPLVDWSTKLGACGVGRRLPMVALSMYAVDRLADDAEDPADLASGPAS
jgi:hypothetical protein